MKPAVAICLALFGVALLVRLYRLAAQSLWLDEGSSWELSRAGWGYLFGELLNPNAAYPLYHLVLKFWMTLFGDSEAALRFPSALAGALAVPVVYLAACELERLVRARAPGRQGARERLSDLPDNGQRSRSPGLPVSAYGLAAALIVLAAPYTIWYSQEAKVYSVLLLAAGLMVWALARALRTGTTRHWAVFLVVSFGALFVHRLAVLLLVAGAWAAVAHLWTRAGHRRWVGAFAVTTLGLSVGVVAAMVRGLGGEAAAGRSVAGAAIPADPPLALGLTFVRFSVDRWPGDGPWWWLLPWAALAVWGLVAALVELRRRETRGRATLLLLLLLVPLGLFLAQLSFTRIYEARYLTALFPVWALLLAYPVGGRLDHEQRERFGEKREREGVQAAQGAKAKNVIYGMLLAGAVATGMLALFQPTFGLFSGDPVKEQYREAIGALAPRVHPDDAVVLHPAYLRPLYDYYMGRLSTDPAPEPIVFFNFWLGETSYAQREWDIERRAKLAGYTRSFLLIAPEHARTVDRPNETSGDEYGLVGNFWRFSREQRAWPCGIWRYNGAHLLCQEAPEAYYTGAVPQPVIPATAVFGGNLRLLGYTLKATMPAGPGIYRAGGNVPISLFWDVGTTPVADYSLFLHLCQRCDQPPVASEDGPPLEGYLPTSTWLPGRPARDDRAVALPRDLPPGRYTLLLGLYNPDDATEAGRLSVWGGEILGTDRLILGTIEVVEPL